MKKNNLSGAPLSDSYHVVFGSGGSRAALGGAGAILAFHMTGLTRWKTIGGASGGSIPAAFMAAGIDAKTVLHLITETEFTSLLTPKTGFLRRLYAILMKYRYERSRPSKGVYSSDRLGAFIDMRVGQWPRGYWTAASCKHGQVLLTDHGVVKYCDDGTMQKLSDTPPTAGDAVRASIAIPGFIDAYNLNGEDLFDGALTSDGECPVEVVNRHFKEDFSKAVAFDVGEEQIKNWWVLRTLWKIFCNGKCDSFDGKRPDEKLGAIVIRPEINGFHALKFKLDINDKWRAILAGFTAALHRMEQAGLCSKVDHADAFELDVQLKDILANTPKSQIASKVETLLSSKGLF